MKILISTAARYINDEMRKFTLFRLSVEQTIVYKKVSVIEKTQKMVLSISLETENDIINLKRDTMETNKSQIQKSEYAPFNKWRRKKWLEHKKSKNGKHLFGRNIEIQMIRNKL